jgi:hypothetical protein
MSTARCTLWLWYGLLTAALCVCVCVGVCVCRCLSACLSVCLPACLPAGLPACLPACLSVCLSVYVRQVGGAAAAPGRRGSGSRWSAADDHCSDGQPATHPRGVRAHLLPAASASCTAERLDLLRFRRFKAKYATEHKCVSERPA